MDFADLEEKIVANNVKLMLLCSPHNPVGRVWTRAELQPEGTYLIWLDCSALGLTAAEREQWLWHKAHLWLDGGGIFGKEGEAFERINVACPRALLLQGLEQLKQAVHELN